MPRVKDDGRDPTATFARQQQDAALRAADDAERNLRKLRKALKKGDVSHSADLLAALNSDASRLATVLAFAERPAPAPD